MLIVGLTGNIAAGKSSVARLFAAWGATLVDADVLAREAVAPGTDALRAIVARWGPEMLAADGTLARAALRQRVFADDAERAALDAMVHPAVGRLREEAVTAARARGDQLVVCDIPLLFEVGLAGSVDAIVLVDAPRAVRHARLLRDRGLTADEANAMIDAQWPSDRKRAAADWVIDNDDTPDTLERTARAVFNAMHTQAVSA
jgi:dephospho-CoA kinase